MGVAVNERPRTYGRGHTEKKRSSHNRFMLEVPLLELMKDKAGYERTFKRFRVNFPVVVQAATQEADAESGGWCGGLPGLAHNISLSGIGFISFGMFTPDTLIEVEITIRVPGAVEAQTHLLLARIRWCRPLELPGDTMYHYGTQFVRTEAVLRFIPDAAQFLLTHGDDRSACPGSRPSVTPATSPRG